MFIIGDEGHYHGRFPWVTVALLSINVTVFTLQAFLGEPFTNGFSLVPEEITEFKDLTHTRYLRVKEEIDRTYDRRGKSHSITVVKNVPIRHHPGPFPIVLTLFTSMFLHGGVLHLIGNMWFLVVFARNVECALGAARFLFFYVLCGALGGIAHVLSDPHSIVPCLGASGAISGVMGAYVAIHPLNKVKVWLGWWIGAIDLPALVVVGVWFLGQYVHAFLSLEHETFRDGVAYWNHVGGFVTGLVFIWATILYLKWQFARESLAAHNEAVEACAEAPSTAADHVERLDAEPPDPFAQCLPPSLRTEEPAAK